MEYAWMQGRDPDSVMKFFTQFAESLAPSYLGLVLAIFLAFFLVYGIGIALLRINKKHKFRELEILFLFFAGFIIALQTAWPIKELRFFFPIYPILLYFVYVGITDFSKRIKHKVQIHESTLSRYLIIIVIAIFLTSSANMIIAKEDTVATDLKAVQQYALEQGILDQNWGSDQRMSAAYYLDPHILHIVDLQGQIIQIMSYNIEYIW